MQEIDEEAIKKSRVVVDDVDAALSETGDLLVPITARTISKDHILGSIGNSLSFREPQCPSL